jgi:hypothetical protein
MKWLYITVGLLATSVCLVGWIYLRDRDTSSYLPPTMPTDQPLHVQDQPPIRPDRRPTKPLLRICPERAGRRGRDYMTARICAGSAVTRLWPPTEISKRIVS